MATAVTAAGSTHAANQRSGRTGRGGLLWPVSPSLLLFSLIIKCCTESRIPPPRIALRSEQGTTVVAWLTGSAVEVHLHLSCPVRPRASACDRATVRMSCVRVATWANQPHSCSRCKSGPHQPCGGSAAPSEARRRSHHANSAELHSAPQRRMRPPMIESYIFFISFVTL